MRVIINVSVPTTKGRGPEFYARAQDRLRRSLIAQNVTEKLEFSTEYPPGSELHPGLPYHFKCMAMNEAAKKYDTMLWLDAPFVALCSLDEVFRIIEQRGYFLWSHPLDKPSIGQWTSDACLKHYGMSRDTALTLPMLYSGVFGWSLKHPLGRKLHEEFVSTSAVALRGSWHNRNLDVSRHRQVKGHRHDQSVLSILAHKLDLEMTPTPHPVALWGHQTPKTVLLHDPDFRYKASTHEEYKCLKI